MSQYYVVRKSDDKDTLQHWKYIKREKVNGKWRYYYDASSLKKYQSGKTTTTKNITTRYENTDKLLDHTLTITDSKGDDHIIKQRGRISQAIDAGKDWLVEKLSGSPVHPDKYDVGVYSKETIKTTYGKHNKIYDSDTSKSIMTAVTGKTTIREVKQGNASRFIARAERWIFNRFFKNK